MQRNLVSITPLYYNGAHMNDVPSQREPSTTLDVVKFTVIALLIVLPIRFFIAQPFIVNGASMEPAFQSGEYLIVDQLSHRFEAPVRGEVVIFRYPKDESKYFIKRVIGLPGETVLVSGETITIFNTEHPEGFVLDEPYLGKDNHESGTITVTLDSDSYFVLGDNRRASSDSRIWGPLPENNIVGRAFLRLLPIDSYELLPGDYRVETP
jgi:signal peptidase I